ncbi:hypothetical protein YC2023_011229 [Brassica napus]
MSSENLVRFFINGSIDDICVNLPLITAKPDIEIVVDLLNLLKLEKSAVEKPFNSTNNSSGNGYFNREAFRRIWNIQTWISCTSSSTALNVYKTWINASYSGISSITPLL